MRDSLVDGARQAIAVGIACAIVGVIIGVLTLTGAASNFAEFVLDVGSRSLFLSLLLTMVVCLILGMGIPTIPNYIITSAIAAPALLKLGVPLIVSHMFVFYFGIMADLTPPVALAAFAAASIAKASPMRIGWKATHIAIAGFVIPYMAVYDPALMLQPTGPGGQVEWLAVVYVVVQDGARDRAVGRRAPIGYLRAPLGLDRAHRRVRRGRAARRRPCRGPTRRASRRARAFIAWHLWRTRGTKRARARGSARRSLNAVCLLVAGVAARDAAGRRLHARVASTRSRRPAGKSDYRVADDRLVLVREPRRRLRRRHGAAAPARRLVDGTWRWRPASRRCRELRITSVAVSPRDYALCWDGRCLPLRTLVRSPASKW